MTDSWQDYVLGEIVTAIQDPALKVVKVASFTNVGTLLAMSKHDALVTVRYDFQGEKASVYLDGTKTGGPPSDTRYHLVAGEGSEVRRLLAALVKRKVAAARNVRAGRRA